MFFPISANWKVTNINCVLEYLYQFSPNLEGLNLSGWKGISSDHLLFLVQEFKSLRRIDLSSINVINYQKMSHCFFFK